MLLHLVGAGVSGFDIVGGLSYLGIWNCPQTIPGIYHRIAISMLRTDMQE